MGSDKSSVETMFFDRPFSKLGFDKLQDIYKNYVDNSVLPNDIVVINQMNCKPILEYSIVCLGFQ